MNYPSLRSVVCVSMLLLSSPCSMAAEWRPISLTVSNGSSAPYYSFIYSASNFLDGSYMPSSSFILSNSANLSSPTYEGETRTQIAFSSVVGSAPFVDQDQHTINVSSIWANAVRGEWDCNIGPCDSRYPKLVWAGQIGWTFGPLDPVSYVVNGDGSFTATWNATDSQWLFNGFGHDTVRFTFAAAVPEPGAALSLAVGAVVVAARARYRRRRDAA